MRSYKRLLHYNERRAIDLNRRRWLVSDNFP